MKICKRTMALLLVLVMALSVVIPVSAAAIPEANTGVRHELCTALSTQAEAYYTGDYTWDNLNTLSAVPTDSSLEAMEGELYTTLQTLMASTQTDAVTYSTLHDYWTTTDTQPGYGNAALFYGDADSALYDYNNHNSVNREHVWPKSHGSFDKENAGCDLHHLRPTKAELNSARGNYIMGDVADNAKIVNLGDKAALWIDEAAGKVEVADNIKGDVARILLYVYTRWGQPNLCVDVPADKLPANDSGSNNDGGRVMDNLDTLLLWCASDPVDAWEMGRNDRTQDVQGNRNVFIDYPEFAWLLFGRDVPADMNTPSGSGSGAPVYQVTAVSNNEAWGTVEAQGSRVICHPAAGYFVAGACAEPADAAELVISGNLIKLNNLTSDVTVTVTFEAKTPATITYLLPEGAAAVEPAVTGFVGDPIELPAVTGDVTVDGKACRFVGWVRSTVADTTDLGETLISKAGESYVVASEEEVFYGLYSYKVVSEDGTGESTTFHKLTAAPADWSGEYVMTGAKGDGTLVLMLADGNDVGGSTGAVALPNTGASQDGDSLNDVTASYVIVIAKADDGTYTIQLKGAANPTYLAFYGSKNKLYTKPDTTDIATRWSIEMLENGAVDIISNQASDGAPRHLQYNVGANMFRCYKSGQQEVLLYAAGEPTVTHYLTLAEAPKQPFVNPFVDVEESDYFYNEVMWAAENGVTSGVNATHFAPDAVCSRAQIVRFLWNAAKQPVSTLTENPFPDVDEDSYYYDAVLWAYENGIVTGKANGNFDPYAKCTRGEIVTLLWRMNNLAMAEDTVNPFPDVHEDSYYYDAVLWAVENEIVFGKADGTFAPGEYSTRGHVACFLYRYFQGK